MVKPHKCQYCGETSPAYFQGTSKTLCKKCISVIKMIDRQSAKPDDINVIRYCKGKGIDISSIVYNKKSLKVGQPSTKSPTYKTSTQQYTNVLQDEEEDDKDFLYSDLNKLDEKVDVMKTYISVNTTNIASIIETVNANYISLKDVIEEDARDKDIRINQNNDLVNEFNKSLTDLDNYVQLRNKQYLQDFDKLSNDVAAMKKDVAVLSKPTSLLFKTVGTVLVKPTVTVPTKPTVTVPTITPIPIVNNTLEADIQKLKDQISKIEARQDDHSKMVKCEIIKTNAMSSDHNRLQIEYNRLKEDHTALSEKHNLLNDEFVKQTEVLALFVKFTNENFAKLGIKIK